MIDEASMDPASCWQKLPQICREFLVQQAVGRQPEALAFAAYQYRWQDVPQALRIQVMRLESPFLWWTRYRLWDLAQRMKIPQPGDMLEEILNWTTEAIEQFREAEPTEEDLLVAMWAEMKQRGEEPESYGPAMTKEDFIARIRRIGVPVPERLLQ